MMNPLSQLKANVHQLVNEHTERHTSTFRHEGTTLTEQGHGMVPPLLKQLHDSISSSLADAAGGTGTSKRIPINAAALSLYERISDQAAAEYVALAKQAPKPTVEGNIRAWMAWSLSSEQLTSRASETTTMWVQEIKTLLNPARTMEIVGACPACGHSKVALEVDGETVQASILVATGDTVTCQSVECGATWVGAELHWLKDALDTTVLGVA